jgi:manganese transport protein
MPHAIFLHSALTQDRIPHDASQRKRLFRFEIIDVIAAMGVAGLINAAMLIVASGTFFVHGLHAVGTLEEAHKTLEPLLGSAASTVFAVSLLASGLSSSTVGTQAGQIIIQGFIKKDIPIWVRRLITVVPSLVVIFLGMDPTRTLVLSQVVLSFCLPLAIVPLMIFTNDKKIMGDLVNRPITKVAMTLVSALIIALDLFLVYNTLWGG